MKRWSIIFTTLLASKRFFYGTIAVFVLSALWFVFSAVYPLAFDEDFHIGVIRIYAEQWSPFLSGQPAGGDAFGSLATDPSYFFHYLMSFPYRLISSFTQNEMAVIIMLRLINVAIVTASLFVFRKVMVRAGASSALAHVSLALLVLIPIMPQLAAHVNYDNLFMLLLAWLCLVVFRIVDGLRQQRFDSQAVLLFVALCLFTSIVKYASLPLLVAAAGYVAWMTYRSFRGHSRKFSKSAAGSFGRISQRSKIAIVVVLGIGLGLFAQRYVANVLSYGTPVPDCGQVLTVDQCKQYGPWGRDYNLEQNRSPEFTPDPAYFAKEWLEGMRHRLFFAVSGAKTTFVNYIELPVITAAFTVLTALSGLAVIVWWRRIFTDSPYLVFFAVMTGVYLALLIFDQYGMYRQTSVPVAINGRYLLPLLPLLAVIVGKAFTIGFAKLRIASYKPYAALLVIVLFLQGGGMLTYLLRADENWYWYNQTVRDVNEAARKTIAPFVIEGDKHKPWH